MQVQQLYFGIFLFITLGIICIFWYVMASSKHPNPDWKVKYSYSFRGKYFYAYSIVILAMLLFTLSMMPYPTEKTTPDVVVPVSAQMFLFNMETPNLKADPKAKPEVPRGKLVEFRVTSPDVTHAFAIYSPKGDIVSQVQAMPGYVNRLRLRLDTPGEYQVLCLEYCGLGHHIMKNEFLVK